MKRSLTAMLGVCLVAAGMTTGAEARTYKLTVAAGQSLRALPSLRMVHEYFVPEVKKRIKAAGLKDDIEFREAYAGSLLKPRRVLLGTQDGIADIGYVPTLFHPDKLPLEQVGFVAPFCTESVSKAVGAVNALYKSVPAMNAQYDKFNVVRLAGSGVDSYELFTNFPVKSVKDLDGKKIGTAGAILQWLKGIGVTSVDSNMMQYYNSTKTGVYQGFIIIASAIPGMKYPEAAPYVTKVRFGAMYAVALVMNKDSLKRLPPALRKIVLEVGRDWGAAGDKAQQAAYERGFSLGKKMFKDAKWSEFSDAERKEWAMKMPNIAQEWAKALDAKGLPGTKVLKGYMDAMRDGGVQCARQWDKE